MTRKNWKYYSKGSQIRRTLTKIFSAGNGGAAELLGISSFLSKPTIDACAEEIIEREGKGVIVFLTSVMSENAIDE